MTFIIANKKYECPKHGVTENYIQSNIPEIPGIWCQICTLEKLDELGIPRLTEIAQTSDGESK